MIIYIIDVTFCYDFDEMILSRLTDYGIMATSHDLNRVRTAQGKPGKPGKRDFFEKNQGKPGKLREFSDHFYNLRENSGNFFLSNISSFISRPSRN